MQKSNRLMTTSCKCVKKWQGDSIDGDLLFYALSTSKSKYFSLVTLKQYYVYAKNTVTYHLR